MWVCVGVVMYTMYRTARLGYSIVIQEGGGGGGSELECNSTCMFVIHFSSGLK